ncbi:MAG: hypothetical protein R3242_02710 [Akkermansiaceae bacterium]|nr:hypothetical protein [Akkermansiaceae bacterium]
MKKNIIIFSKPLSWVSLLLIVVPPILFYVDSIAAETMNALLLAGTVVWFVTASLWMKGE